jgi:DNA repair exonuclease SbcCD nuclease subunit
MKIIHTGDIHLGSALTSLPPDKAALRKAEILEGFRNLAIYARNNGVRAVLIAGDLFDENKVSKQLKNEVFSIIAAATPVAFFYVSGNHDDEFDSNELLPKNLYTFTQNHGWGSFALSENVTVTGMDSKFMDKKTISSLFLQKNTFNIVVLHGNIAKEREEDSIPLTRLQGKHIDYLALGHIHKPMPKTERLDGRGVYRYCGCLEGRGFDECGARGFFLLEIQNGALVSEAFLSLAKRMVCEVRADISYCNTYYVVERAVAQSLASSPKQNIVKLTLCGKYRAGLKTDITLLTQRINEAFFFAKVEDESSLYIDYNEYKNDLSERGEFVREVSKSELGEEIKAEILDVGLKALAGEEIDL